MQKDMAEQEKAMEELAKQMDAAAK
jgi:hypothetical protein